MAIDPQVGVFELLDARLKSRSRSDGYTLALALEGGGMRGVVSGAMLIALRDTGLADVIDRFYGTSSGSINLAYFAAGHSWDALSVYYEHLVSGFVQRTRRTMWVPGVNMDYLFADVMANKVPLNVDKLFQSSLDIRIVLTNVDECRPEIHRLSDDRILALEYLRAGAWLPMLAGPAPVVRGHRYLDGGVLYADPMYGALAEDNTHVLVLNTVAIAGVSEHSPSTRRLLRGVLNRWRRGLGDGYYESRRRWDDDSLAIGFSQDRSIAGTHVARVAPVAGSHRVRRMTTARADLLDGARAGYSAVLDIVSTDRGPLYFAVTS